MRTINVRRAILAGIIFIILVSFFTYVKYHRYHQGLSIVVSADAQGYHQYLTALFIHHDIFEQPYSFVLEDGRFFNKYNYGVAFLQLPFFLASHAIAEIFNLPAEGNLTVYIVGVILSGVLYTFLGLLILFGLLRRKFSPTTTWITLTIIFLGTNLVFYAYREPGMSHVYAFFLVALFINAVHQYYDQPGFKPALLMGLSLGLLAVIRLPHILIGLYLILFRVSTVKDLRKNLHFLKSYWTPLLVIPFFIILFYIPQMLYWHALTGNYFVNPYDYSLVDEGFSNWKNPEIGVVLFGPRGGWLVYSPLLLLALAGAVWQTLKKEGSPWLVLFIVVVTTYLYGSWWSPTLACSFGHRGFVDLYALLALPLAWIIQKIVRSGKVVKMIFSVSVFLLIYLNLYISFKFKYPWWEQEWGWQDYFTIVGNAFLISQGG